MPEYIPMRLITFTPAEAPAQRAGLLVDQTVFEAGPLVGLSATTSVRSLLEQGPDVLAALDRAASRAVAADGDRCYRVQDVALGPPIPDPDKILCVGLNYRAHARESGLELPKVPTFFAKFRNSLTGPRGDILLPRMSQAIDYEAELAVVIGRRCKDVDVDSALDYVAGAMALNDVSARDLQLATSQWTMGKAIDTFAPCGPAVVTLDEVGDIQDLALTTTLNGELVQEGTTADMHFSTAEVISHLSGVMTLVPGDIVATGTPAGVGSGHDPPIVLGPGDIVEVEVERIGSLVNRVVANVNGASRSTSSE
jgi:2-keto-4-pentenoate hydratase/2-oxohepta-3-ene-1,7-dioic acid hydratase in catechol pathway